MENEDDRMGAVAALLRLDLLQSIVDMTADRHENVVYISQGGIHPQYLPTSSLMPLYVLVG